MPPLPPPEPTVSCFDDLDFFKDFKNEFPAIVYNDAPTSKSDLLTELILSPQHINEFDLNDETSFSEYDEEEQNILYFNDLFPFNIIHTDDLKFLYSTFISEFLQNPEMSLLEKKAIITSVLEGVWYQQVVNDSGLQVMQRDNGTFISQDKYVADILKKFDFVTMKTASTPIEAHKALLKDEEAEDVDVHLYRSMIGS
ncbi:hypothetical protein Tco_1281764 [Tanacetum coccineum]